MRRIFPLKSLFPQIGHFSSVTNRLPALTAHRFIDLLLPDQCRICGAASPGAGYCRDCAGALPRHDRQCRTCGVPVGFDGICGRCQHDPPPFTETIAPFLYAPPVSEDILKLKYHRKLACGRDLGTLLAREVAARLPELPDVLVPVPLHWKRQFRRGFNQSVEIARPVSSALDIPIETGLVRRRFHTLPQVGLRPAQRRRNLRGVFEPSSKPMPGSAAIIDDVITSGATVAALARCLRAAGIEHVTVWALARA